MRTILTILLTLVAASTFAQDQLLRTSAQSLNTEIDLARDQLTVTDRSQSIAEANLSNLNLRLEGGNLIIGYQLQGTGRNEYYQVGLAVTLDGQPLRIPPESLSGDLGAEIFAEERLTLKRIIWINPLETYPTLRGSLAITLTAELYGAVALPFNIDCDNPPSFTGKEQLPHFIAAGVGLGSVLIGQALLSSADDTYENDYLTSSTATDAEPFFEDANSQRHTALTLTYAGATILAVDAGWYLWRLFRYKSQQKAFEQYCPKGNVRVRPLYRRGVPGGGNAVVGLKVKVGL